MSGSRAFQTQMRLLVNKHLSPQAISAKLATYAKQQLAEAIQGGASPDYMRFVDGVRDVPEEQVKHNGAIVYRFNLMAFAAQLALDELRKRAPVGTGPMHRRAYPERYRDSFFFGLNEKFVMARNFNPKTAGSLDKVVIGNVQPYSRKIDVQFIGNRRLQYDVGAQDLFLMASRLVQNRFPNLTVKRLYTVTFPGQYRLKRVQMRTGRQKHRIKRIPGELVESPAIMITAR